MRRRVIRRWFRRVADVRQLFREDEKGASLIPVTQPPLQNTPSPLLAVLMVLLLLDLQPKFGIIRAWVIVVPHVIKAAMLGRKHQKVAVCNSQMLPAGILKVIGAVELLNVFRLPTVALPDNRVVVDVATPLFRVPVADALHV